MNGQVRVAAAKIRHDPITHNQAHTPAGTDVALFAQTAHDDGGAGSPGGAIAAALVSASSRSAASSPAHCWRVKITNTADAAITIMTASTAAQ